MSDLDVYLSSLGTTDVRKKIQIGEGIITFLSNSDNSIQCEDIGAFIDGLVPWVNNSNYKVCQNGLEILILLVGKLKDDFRPFIQTVLPPVVDRLGDSKDSVRDKAQELIVKFMESSTQPQHLWDKLVAGFSHRNSKVREEIHKILVVTLNNYGSSSLSLNKLVPSIVKCLSDPTPSVRDAAFNTLMDVYRHVGDKVRIDLEKRGNVPPAKFPAILAKFDELRETGQLLPSAFDGSQKPEDEPDRACTTTTKRLISAPGTRKPAPGTIPKANAFSMMSSGSLAGGVDEETFMKSFEDVPKVQFFSLKELEDHLTYIKNTIQDANNDWSKRVEALRKMRSLLINGAASYEELWQHLRAMEHAFQTSVKDLRSQVVREACITIAFMSHQLQNKLDHFSEALLNPLINLIPNSAKIMATAGTVCIRFLIAYTHNSRLVPILAQHITGSTSSKSKDIRRAICEFFDQLLHTWPIHILEKHVVVIQNALSSGIRDADPDARAFARRAYGGFALHFPTHADNLLHSLDLSYQKLLQGETTLSSSSSSQSLHSMGLNRTPSATLNSNPSSIGNPSRSKMGSTENVSRLPYIPTTTRRNIPLSGVRAGISGNGAHCNVRSSSAIDLNAANRAVRNMKGGTISSHHVKSENTNSGHVSMLSPEQRDSRNRARGSGTSQSQPGSRSGSPSSRLSYKSYDHSANTPTRHVESLTLGRPRRLSSSGMSINSPSNRGHSSTNASRETSPSRGGNHTSVPKLRMRSQSGGYSERGTPGRPVLAQRILQQSREAENALSDALVSQKSRPRTTGCDEHSDESETSSVCSDRSFDSVNRRLERNNRDNWFDLPNRDIGTILSACASTHWSERKEGLVALQAYLRAGNSLPLPDLRKLVEILGRMFTDAHTKVFSLFLDALALLIETHKDDLHDNLYFLISRLLNKLGADLLGSVQAKTLKILDLVRMCFPLSLQFALILRFMMDNTQTPNSRVKVAMLHYLIALLRDMQPSDLTTVTLQTSVSDAGNGSYGTTMANVSQQLVEASVAKIVAWTSDIRSVEVRRASQDALYALFSLHPGEVTRILSSLPKVCQDSASQVIQLQLNRASDTASFTKSDATMTSSTCSSPLKSPLSPSSEPTTPSRLPVYTNDPSLQSHLTSSKSFKGQDSVELNPEEVYRSIRRTTAEIQNYSFEGSSLESDGAGESATVTTRPTTEEARKEIAALRLVDSPLRQKVVESDSVMSPMEHNDRATMQRILGLFVVEDSGSRKDAMQLLNALMHQGAGNLIETNFRPVFKHLVSCREDPDPVVRRQVFSLWSTMLSTPRLAEEMENYADLILVNIFRAQRDQEREVVRAAEGCAKTLAAVMSLNKLIRILKHAIGDNYPENYTAIKTLTRLVEQRPPEDTVSILPEIMPALLRATDHAESIVRKAAVFCIVEIYKRAAEDLKPYLESLNSSKLKLINVYIQRACSAQ